MFFLFDVSRLNNYLFFYCELFASGNWLSCRFMYIFCSDGLILFENLPYEAQNLDSAGPESLRQLDVEVPV